VIEGCYRQGQRVLFVAPTHVAVDQAMLRVCERLQNEPGFDRGLVHRDKGAQLNELGDRFGAFIDPRQIESRLMARLHQQTEELRRERSRLSAQVASLQEFDVVQRTLADLGRGRAGAAPQIDGNVRQGAVLVVLQHHAGALPGGEAAQRFQQVSPVDHRRRRIADRFVRGQPTNQQGPPLPPSPLIEVLVEHRLSHVRLDRPPIPVPARATEGADQRFLHQVRGLLPVPAEQEPVPVQSRTANPDQVREVIRPNRPPASSLLIPTHPHERGCAAVGGIAIRRPLRGGCFGKSADTTAACPGRGTCGPKATRGSADVLCSCKGQEAVERRYHGFEGPLAVAPMFLRNNKRMTTLITVIALALLIYCLRSNAKSAPSSPRPPPRPAWAPDTPPNPPRT